MTKQEEIREGIGIRLCGYGNDVRIENCDAYIFFVEPHTCKKRDDFISYLHSQDVVIKGKEHPRYTGYVATESLIKEIEPLEFHGYKEYETSVGR